MKRQWAIFHLEDQPKDTDTAISTFSDMLLIPLSGIKPQLNRAISLQDLLKKQKSFFDPANDFYWMNDDIFNEISKDEYNDFQETRIIDYENLESRLPIYYISLTLSDGWEFIESAFSEEFNIDLIVLDIKMHQIANTNTQQKGYDEEIMGIYLNCLEMPNDVFADKNVNKFREMGGIVLFGKIMRSLKSIKNKPIIVIQTASTVIDQYSAFEYAFPEHVVVVKKILEYQDEEHKTFYEKLIEKCISKKFYEGELSSIKLESCITKILQCLPSSNLDHYEEIINFPLDSKEAGWVFGSLFPWIANDILSIKDKDKIIVTIEPLRKFCQMNDWTSELNIYFERLPLRLITHPNSIGEEPLPQYHNEDKDWTGDLESLIIRNNNKAIKDRIYETTPDFILDSIKDPDKSLSHMAIKTFAEYLDKVPSNEQILKDKSTYQENKRRKNCLIDKYSCELECAAYWLCKLENEKEKFKGKPDSNILNILSEVISIYPNINVSVINDVTSLPPYLRNNLEKISIVQNGFEFQKDIINNNLEFVRCYTPWDSLKDLIRIIIKEKVDTKLEFGLFYSSEQKKIILVLQTDKEFLNLQNHKLSNGEIDRKFSAMKFWMNIYICSQKTFRNIFLSDEIESYPDLDIPIQGTQLIFSISVVEKTK